MQGYAHALRPGVARWENVLFQGIQVGWPETTAPIAEKPEPPREAPRHDPLDPDGEQHGRRREPDPETSNDGDAPPLPEAPDRGVDEPSRTDPR